MIVAIHQPHFLPWLGYLHRMAKADLFIVLDHVQFERRNYQNRARIRMNGEARWLTVPVVQRSQKERILDKEVDNRDGGASGWGPKSFDTLRHAYCDAPFFSLYEASLRRLLRARWERLADIDRASVELLREAFGIRTPMVSSAELAADGAKGELILNLCCAVGARKLLAGLGGSRSYLDREAFERAGVAIEFQDFRHPVYPQCGEAAFLPGLSAIDCLLNCGPRSRDLLLPQAGPHDSRAAA